MDFKEEYDRIMAKIDNGEHFALARYGDGERMLMCGETVSEGTQARQQDKWMSHGQTLLGQDLANTLSIVDDNYIYAIPCQCCQVKGKQWYFDHIESRNFTYANIFINSNYRYFRERAKNTDKDIYLIANHEGEGKEYPFNVTSYLSMQDDCVGYYEHNKYQLLDAVKKIALSYTDQLFFISVGPLANIIVYEMRKANPNNTYIDVGSAIDEFTKGRVTRGFQRDQDHYANMVCVF